MRHNREPIGNTCGQIDKYIKSINAATYYVNYLKGDILTGSELIESAVEMSEELTRCEDYLEDMRSANSTLRDWGCVEAEQVDSLAGTVSDLESQVDDLQDEIKSLKKEIDRLEGKVYNLEGELETLTNLNTSLELRIKDTEESLQSTKSDLEWYEDRHK